MSDVFTKKKRSEVMSRIRGKGNKETEETIASLLRRNSIVGWRRHQPVFGRPDFIFRKRHLALFIDGCFWHCCPHHSNLPVNNRTFWRLKLASNRARDLFVTRTLQNKGWKVLRVWEHELQRPEKVARKIQAALFRQAAHRFRERS